MDNPDKQQHPDHRGQRPLHAMLIICLLAVAVYVGFRMGAARGTGGGGPEPLAGNPGGSSGNPPTQRQLRHRGHDLGVHPPAGAGAGGVTGQPAAWPEGFPLPGPANGTGSGAPALVSGAASQAAGNPQTGEGAQRRPVEILNVAWRVRKSPDYTLKGGTTEKRWHPRNWLEIEPEFKIPRPEPGGTAARFHELTFKYHVLLAGADSRAGEWRGRVLTVSITHTGIPVDEVCHSVVYLSPSAFYGLTGVREADSALVAGGAVEILSGGNVVARWSRLREAAAADTGTGSWREAVSGLPEEPGLVDKTQTPFAPLWSGWHAEVKPAGSWPSPPRAG